MVSSMVGVPRGRSLLFNKASKGKRFTPVTTCSTYIHDETQMQPLLINNLKKDEVRTLRPKKLHNFKKRHYVIE